MTTRQLQMRVLERAYDANADRKSIAMAFALMKTGSIELIVLLTAGRMMVRAKEKHLG